MKALIAVFLVCIGFWISKQLFLTYLKSEKQPLYSLEATNTPQQPASASAALTGLPATLEASLSAAEKQGAAGLRDWLRNYRQHVRDPRLAAIELDYVVLISRQDPAEAKRIFKEVKGRTPTFSPIYDRVKRLENTFHD